MPLLTEGTEKESYECVAFEGMLFTVTADGKIGVVEGIPAVVCAEKPAVNARHTLKVIIAETDYYYDKNAGVYEHFVDVFLDDESAVVKISVCGTRIKKIVRFS
ncbi:hypothetical protein Cni_G21906 [Canna indica]|uniref:Uncharacterized protein n=1 Tax=Canna indica TaxID=4628 RepID=A0AAQ3KVT7_9LILI|nr:hypothetical protein Cni_G21905 [Canna indica]WOL13137.1 hypothetical protein Cni_G21906 [Canna indica]